MQILLDVRNDKADFLMELLRNFRFVKAKPVTSEKERILRDLKHSVEEVKLHKAGKIKLKSADELFNEL
jgi:hypothetical protein